MSTRKKNQSASQIPPKTPPPILKNVSISHEQSGVYYIKFYNNNNNSKFKISHNDIYEINGEEYKFEMKMVILSPKLTQNKKGEVTLEIGFFDTKNKKNKYIYWKEYSYFDKDPDQGIIELGFNLKDYINGDNNEDKNQKRLKQFVIDKFSEAPHPTEKKLFGRRASIFKDSDSEDSDLEDSDPEDFDLEDPPQKTSPPQKTPIRKSLPRRLRFGRLRFGRLRFGRLRFGRLRFGRLRFGKTTKFKYSAVGGEAGRSIFIS